MTKIVTVDEMKVIEEAADASGLTYDEMMVNAGASVADHIVARREVGAGTKVLVLVGSGNNGGDGLVVANLLAERGAQVAVYLTKERDDRHFAEFAGRGLLAAHADQDQRSRVLRLQLESADLIVDALLGTGFRLPLKGSAEKLLKTCKMVLDLRKQSPYIVAVDCPSGLDCDSGEVAPETLHADLTVTLAAAKPGLLAFPGADYVGELAIGDIGLPDNQQELASIRTELADSGGAGALLPARPRSAHKGTFGRVVVLAGSTNYPGAAALAARGAYLSGAGLVTLAVPSPVQALTAPLLPEVTWVLLPHEVGVFAEGGVELIREELEGVDALLFGPGFGLEQATRDFLATLLGARESGGGIGFHADSPEARAQRTSLPPTVVDADGLKLLSKLPNWPSLLPEDSILTPHPGELQVMTGVAKEELQRERVETARSWAEKWGHILLLKGAFSVVAAPDGRAMVIPVATSALARAGTGDVLAGIVAGLRGQGLPAFEAAWMGAYIHAQAGLRAGQRRGEAGVLAGDVAACISDVMKDLA